MTRRLTRIAAGCRRGTCETSALNTVALLTLLAFPAFAQSAAPHLLTPVPVQQVLIEDDFWSPKLTVWREITIPDCLAKFEKDGALANFDKIRDGAGGDHGGPPWYDGLIYEMIRGCADFLASKPDPALEARLDGYIERIAAAAAKDPDGYLNTYTQLKEPLHRWGLNGGNDQWQHDVYNASAMIEAAVHYYRATGRTRLLETAARLANHMADVMGPSPKKNVVPGHSLGEEALVKLYLLFREMPQLKSRMPVPVDEQRYLALAEFWIENRGNHEGRASYGPYGQDDQPVLRQQTIEGHAVRATLLCAGLVAAANVNGREDYFTAARRLWDNMVLRRMYITGGLGAVAGYEGFGPDYALPNNGYLETCAAVGAGFFHQNMNLAFADARYADELERALFNGILSGVSLKGDAYFYENPLEADEKRTRWAWHGCPCCPPMFLKIMGALPGCIYAQEPGAVFVNQFIGSLAKLTVNGVPLSLRQTTRYPWDGDVKFAVEPEREADFAINVRLPGWCREPRLQVNGSPLAAFEKVRGYARLQRTWRRGDVIELSLPMPARRVQANPKVEADIGRMAIERGPLVYCLEAVDNGGHVRNIVIPPEAPLDAQYRPDLLGGATVIDGPALALTQEAWPDALYASSASVPGVTKVRFTAIPYYANANRQAGEMRVWMAEAADKAEPLPAVGRAREAAITVRANQTLHAVSRYLTGACIEDVNHEIYGGLYSQMIFGESFQEPSESLQIEGFKSYGGEWKIKGDALWADGGEGPKLVSDYPPFASGEAGVDVFLSDRGAGNAGLIVKVSAPGKGADNFDGYEVSLDAQANILRLGRHRHNFELIRDVPCQAPLGQWIPLEVKMTEKTIEVLVNGKSVIQYEDREHPLNSGAVGLRPWAREARYRNLWVQSAAGTKTALSFKPKGGQSDAVSRMWRPVRRGQAIGQWRLDSGHPFLGNQSQRITLVGGAGEIGVENQGLNRWGMSFIAGKPYEGCLWARAEQPVELFVALERRDGATVYAASHLAVTSNDWQRLDFTLTPTQTDKAGRFAVTLKQPGSVALGYVFLQPGEWGRFKGLPVRKDIAEALIDEGVTVLRYGGSMVNHPQYRWKNMIGPRDQRPPCQGTWYPQSSNGWGILDFLDFCGAAGFRSIPAFNMGESPRDMADFIEYVNGPADSDWGRRRVAAGHPEPYRLKYLELGNEEQVDENYWQKFKPMAEALWARDPEIIPVVGDFFYNKVIKDPFNFDGGAVKTLAAHKRILDLARDHGREVWFDVHAGTEEPPQPGNLAGERSFIEQLGKLSPGAKYKVVIFEFNAGNHALKRALANACAINQVERVGDKLPVACSANCLQPDGQNDNDWDQGLLFLNPSQVWLQPPGYVTRMVSRNYEPWLVSAEVQGAADQLSVNAKRSEDNKTLVLQAVNIGGEPVSADIHLDGFVPSHPTALVQQLAGSLDEVNTAQDPEHIKPAIGQWRHQCAEGLARYTFPPHSFTVIRFE